MGDNANHELELLLAQLEAMVSAAVEPAQEAGFRAFMRHFYEMSSQDTLKARSPEALFSIALAHWKLVQRRAPGEVLIELEPPPADGSREMAALRTNTDDMPFLVDTLTMAVRKAGSPIDWSVHPVMRISRDAEHRFQASAGLTSAQGQPESLVHIEFEPLPDPEDYQRLEAELRRVLVELRAVVEDFGPMKERLRQLIELLARPADPSKAERFAEAREFLAWLGENHFTFLGYAESRTREVDGKRTFEPVPEAGLGLLRPGSDMSRTEEFIAPQEELDKYAHSVRLVVVTKAITRSPIHHDEYMDVISVKSHDDKGNVRGTHRFLGLFSSDVYTARPREIPLVRQKAEYVLQRARLPAGSHSYKNLSEILHSLPRDELFQSSEEELFQVCMGIGALRDRHQLRLFMRRDRYGRFYSCMVYMPRERYTRELREKIGAELAAICNASRIDRNVEFLRDGLARVHYIVRTPPGTQIPLSVEEVEARLIAATRSWRDQLRDLLARTHGDQAATLVATFGDAFPLSYTERTTPVEAAADIQYLRRLGEATPVLPRLLVSRDADTAQPVALKLYSWRSPVELSDVLPTLENLGLRVIRQEPASVEPRGREPMWIQEFDIRVSRPCRLSPDDQKSYFETAFQKVWSGETEDDGLGRLVLAAGLDYRQVTCLRAICKYLLQTGIPFSQAYIEQLLSDHAQIAQLLVRLFETRFNPQTDPERRAEATAEVEAELLEKLDAVATLDGDRVLRAFLSVVQATLRTNYFQPAADGSIKPWITLKLDPSKIPELPRPLPKFEAFVYSPEVEGVHLRGGLVARGGLRWSDRREDFRTEVLGLMKAQMVKNAVIVPVGAKGGFVVKKPVDPADREAWLAQGVACYKTFLRGLLDITDNRVGDDVVPPKAVVRYDGDDPYLVVAADKGTATFSDIANGISAEYGHWLGDAFASGGSAGYDHKKMGITARGAWESVKRHFRELGKDIQQEPFTVVGVGDMSGDVFGNGMLLSRQIRLIAAFDHRHVFIDPNPDPASSWEERKRLFDLGRSSWDDYDRKLISEGGGVWPRSSKVIKLSAAAREALGIDRGTLTPNELLRAILLAPVDLLWNGGIGTYVKASSESHQEVGDRANDAIRVNGKDLRVKVVGEGGNLGLTQRGRIEFALAGGRLNTDAIDNSGGVHSSDREVNIKIPLNQLMAEQRLTLEERNPLLERMTDDVARAVLRDNYVQSEAISLLEIDSARRLDEHANLMKTLERDGLLDRAVEYLPDEEMLNERRSRGLGLTRPELSVLLSYSKISLFGSMLASDVPDDPFFERDLLAYFPTELRESQPDVLRSHRLRREIISTILSNAVVNRMGMAFAHRMGDDHGIPRAQVLKAYAAAHEVFEADSYWCAVDALDNRVPSKVQYGLMSRPIGLLKHVTGWLLNYGYAERPIGDIVQRFHDPIRALESMLPDVLPRAYREDWERAVRGMTADGVPEDLALRLANTKVLGSAPDIAELADGAAVSLQDAANVYFEVGQRLRVPWLLSSIIGLQVTGKWQAIARSNLRDDTYRLHRLLAGRILEFDGDGAAERIGAWMDANPRKIEFGIRQIQELQNSGSADFLALAVGVRELRKLRML